jgi:hypothetical protein
MAKRIYTEEEVYDIVSQKWNVDFPDGSVDSFELMAKAEGMGFKYLGDEMYRKTK